MRKLISIILILFHLILITPVEEVFAAEYRLKAYTLSPGKKASSTDFKLKQTVSSEPFGGEASNNSYKVKFGYIHSTASNYPRFKSNIPDNFTSGSMDLDDYFEDPCGGTLTYSFTGNNRINVTIDSITHVVTWSYPDDFVGSEEIFFIAENSERARARSNGVILTARSPSGTNNAPKLHYIPDITAFEGDTISINASAYDADGDTLVYTYTHPFDSNGQWEVNYEDAGRYAVTITVKDGNGGSDSQIVNVIIYNTDRAPIIKSINGILVVDGNATLSSVDEGTLVKLEPHAYDPDGDLISFKYESPFDSEGSCQIPYNFTGKESTKSLRSKITASDGIFSSSIYANIAINNVNAAPIVNLSLSSCSVKENVDFTITINTSDPDNDKMKLTLKKIKNGVEEIIEDYIGAVQDRDITSIYSTKYSISGIGTYTIKAIVNDITILNPKETVASAYLEVTPTSQNEDGVKPISGDFNGDGLTDIGYLDTSSGSWYISISQDGNFNGSKAWLTDFGRDEKAVPIIGDFNADGLTDIGYFDKSGTFKIKFSTGSSFGDDTIVVTSSGESRVYRYGSGTSGGVAVIVYSPFTGDFNGDGLTDIGYYHNYTDNYNLSGGYTGRAGGEKHVAYSTGSGFEVFKDLSGPNYYGYMSITSDFNQDGISDFCLKDKGNWKLIICNGDTLINNVIEASDFGEGKDPVIGDFNQDGLTDIGYYDHASGKIYYRIFTGEGFLEPANGVYLEGLKTGSNDNLSASISDYNGDAIMDGATFDKTKFGINKWSLVLHQSKLPDLLIGIDNGIGGTTTIEYEVSTKLDNTGADGNPATQDLPFPLRVVKKVTRHPGGVSADTVGASGGDSSGVFKGYITHYNYKYGYFETYSREFRGFGYVRVIDPEGHYSETYFNQDDTYKGRPSLEVVYDKYNRKIQEVDYDWQYIQYHSQLVTFPYLDSKTTTLYDYKTGDSKQIQTLYDYDDYGNTVKVRDEGFLDETGDEKETNIAYEYNIAKYILSKPKTTEHLGGGGAAGADSPEVKSRFTYDDNGSLLKEERWLNTESRWLATDFTYDAYGNVITVTDALSRTTTTTYDSTKTFPASVQNTLGHTQSFTYDCATGKILTSTDPNGQSTASIYDGFGRLTRVTGPGGISEVTYTYDLTSRPVKITSTTKASDTETLTTYSWADGLGRTIETISEADDGKYILSGLVKYDSRGQVIEKYLPEYVVGAGFNPPSYSGKHVTYHYDPLGRVVMTIRLDNKVSQNIYAITSIEIINENAQRKRLTKDAYGRIVTVEEFNAGSTYTTTYEYDTLDNLIKTTDTLGNITTIKYDSLGRKIDMNDPDMGVWSYTYDDVGNLISQTDNKGQTITFQYDNINRLTSKTTGVTYTYDLNANGKGRLSKVEDLSGTTEFFYDILGREERTVKVIDGRSYSIEREYDSLDRLTNVTYPDTVVVKYEYNKQGGIKKVYSPGTGGDVTYVSDAKYSENGQLLELTYGNGRKTTYDYDPNNLRLEHLLTANTAGSDPIQDLSYTFDPVGNVKQITDAVNSNTQSFSYDDLNRLTSATGPHYGTQVYEYDAIGNMLRKGDKTLIYGEGSAGPHAVTKYDNTVITYDPNGNMMAKGSTAYTYDTENRLTEVAVPNGGSVSSVTLNFTAGWNFFSIPYKMIDVSGTLTAIENIPIKTILSDINGKYDQISKYDESIDDPNTGHWQHYVGNSKFDQFLYFNYGDGYLIYTNSACSLTLTGSTPTTTQQKTLNSGWNLVLGPTTTSRPVQDALEGVTYDSVKHYNGTTYDDISTFEAGEAYWIHTASIQAWNVKAEEDITRFVYDGDGGRTKRTYEDRTTIYIGSSYEIEIDNTTNEVVKLKKLIYMGSNRVCEIEQAGESIHAYFTHADHIGSSNIITDESGQRVSLFEYKPFGSVAYAAEDNTYDTDKRFTGKTYDKTTNLHYYGARYYDSELCRFITADPTIQHPYDPQDFNRYAYCRNNPVTYVDPTGYGFWSWLKSFFAAFVGAVITAVLSPFLTLPIAGMIGGAVAGAMMGALNGGGLEGALKGALWGGAFGLVAGGIYHGLGPGFGAVFLGGVAIGGAVYAGVAGGGEGLANYAAGVLGAVYGASLGSALINSPLQTQEQTSNTDGSSVSDERLAAAQEALTTDLSDDPRIEVYESGKDMLNTGEGAGPRVHTTAYNTGTGEYTELEVVGGKVNILKGELLEMRPVTQKYMETHPKPNPRLSWNASQSKFDKAINKYIKTYQDKSYVYGQCRHYISYLRKHSEIK